MAAVAALLLICGFLAVIDENLTDRGRLTFGLSCGAGGFLLLVLNLLGQPIPVP